MYSWPVMLWTVAYLLATAITVGADGEYFIFVRYEM
jgi:hypothetical protein